HPYLRYVNHSCDPNSFIDKKDRVLRALRPIHPFEEITFDYLVNESEIASPFQCDCGVPNCRRLIRKERGKEEVLTVAPPGPGPLLEQGGVHHGRRDQRRRPDAEVSPEPGQVPAPRTAEEKGAEQRHEGDAAQDAEEYRPHHTNPRQGPNEHRTCRGRW